MNIMHQHSPPSTKTQRSHSALMDKNQVAGVVAVAVKVGLGGA